MITVEQIKRAVGKKAAELVQSGMTIGLGTGSTASYFIEHLIALCKQGLKVKAIASSKRSEIQAAQGGIPILDINTVISLDLYIDGADAMDAQKRMIKGGGGALVREKIAASMSQEMIVIIDASKMVSHLSKHPLPVEIIPFGMQATYHKIQQLGFQGTLRLEKDGTPYLTDNSNYIFDIALKTTSVPETVHEQLIHIPGVVDTGFFFHLAGRVVVGFPDGQVLIKE